MIIPCEEDQHCEVLVWWASMISDDPPILIHAMRHHDLCVDQLYLFPAPNATWSALISDCGCVYHDSHDQCKTDCGNEWRCKLPLGSDDD